MKLNFEMAMDWTVAPDGSGTLMPVLLENDTCAIGGLLTLAAMWHAWRRCWKTADLSDFEDNTLYLNSLLDEINAQSRAFGNGIPLVFVEKCLHPYLGPNATSWLRKALDARGIRVCGPWNKRHLRFDRHSNRYIFSGQPVSFLMLYYYPFTFDTTYDEYSGVAPMYKTAYERSHAVNGYWRSFHGGGYRLWGQTNPLGSELFCDKAIVAFLPNLVRFYLKNEPELRETGYRLFCQRSAGDLNVSLSEVFDDPHRWVVKSRRDSGMGLGVFIGQSMCDGQVQNGLTWQQLRQEVQRSPESYVAQRYFTDLEAHVAGAGLVSFELRNIVHIFGEKRLTVEPLLMRAAPRGERRNISSNPRCRCIPVLCPR